MAVQRLSGVKKLLFISTGNSGKGPHGEICLPALSRDGWEITVVAPEAENSLLNRLLPYRAAFKNLPAYGPRQELAIMRLLLASRMFPGTVLYLHSQSLSLRAWLWLLGPKFGKRIVYHNPDYYDPFNYPLHHFAEKRLCRKCDLCLNNEFHRAYITRASYRLRCPIVTVPIMLPAAWPFPATSPQVRREICGGQDGQFVLILHGGYGEVRMVPQLFEALALLPERFRLVMFIKEHREIETTAHLDRLGIAGRVQRFPGMGLDGLLKYTVTADAGMLLYSNNDLGNFFTAPGRLTEYLGAGLPVLATNHTGLENLVWRLDVGVTVDSTRPRQIADGILRLEALKLKGRFPAGRMRRVFLEDLAFDLWETDICAAFNELALPRREWKKAAPPAFPWLKSKPE